MDEEIEIIDSSASTNDNLTNQEVKEDQEVNTNNELENIALESNTVSDTPQENSTSEVIEPINEEVSEDGVSDKTEILDLDLNQEALNALENNMPKVKEEVLAPEKSEVLDVKEEKKGLFSKKKEEEIPVKENNNEVNIYETATLQGQANSAVIGNIEGENSVANNNAMPENIDITIKQKEDVKNNNKKVKVVSKKDKIITTVITIFVILVLIGAGYSAYYFGYLNNPNIYKVKTIYLELGDELPATVSYYVESPLQIDDMQYSVDTSQVAYDIIGTYSYSVSHNGVTKTGQVIVRDTTVPKLVIKNEEDLIFMKDATITKEDIVESCEDISNCTYKLENEIATDTAGEKEVKVIAVDEQNNETSANAKVTIVDIQRTITCETSLQENEDKTYSTSTSVTLNFDSNDELVQAVGGTKYVYSDYSAYFNILNENKENKDYTFEKATFSYILKGNVDTNNLTSFNDLLKYFSDNGYTCK